MTGDSAPKTKANGRLKYWVKLLISLGLSALFLYLAVDALTGCPEGGRCESGQCVFDDADVCGTEDSPCPTCVDGSNLSTQLGDVSILALVLF